MIHPRFKIFSYSRSRPTNEIEEEAVINAIARLYVAREKEQGDNPEEIEGREYAVGIITEDRSAFVLVRDGDTAEFVGYSSLEYARHPSFPFKETDAEFGYGFVLPEYRKRGIFGEMIESTCSAALELGYRRIVGYPNDLSRSVVEKHGFIVFKEFSDEDVLIKHLRSPGIETRRGSNDHLRRR